MKFESLKQSKFELIINFVWSKVFLIFAFPNRNSMSFIL